MSFLKRNWRVIIVGFAVFAAGALVLLQNNQSLEPVILYKTTQPSKPQTNVGNTVNPATHNHNHSHDTAPHSHAVEETPSREEYDWRDDNTLVSLRAKADPWKQTYTQDTNAESYEGTNEGTYPPRDWHKTEDPVLFAKYLNAQLLKQFGDIPEVRIIGEYELNKAMGITPTVEEHIAFREAHYHLFPTEANKRTLEALKRVISNGGQIIFNRRNPK